MIQKYLIKSIGDSIKEGEYKIHSRFKNVVNFVSGDNLCAIVNAEIGESPVNIVLNNDTLKGINELKITNENITINSEEHQISNFSKYNSEYQLPEISIKDISNKLYGSYSELKYYFPKKSLDFLLSSEKKSDFTSSFDKALVNHVKNAFELILNNKIIEGIKKIKGVGYGLTPSGDDFIAGLLFASRIIDKCNNTNSQLSRNNILKNAKGTNLISNNFLTLASKGKYSISFKFFVKSLCEGNKNGYCKAAKKLLTIGETSGADLLTGFIITIMNKIKI